MIAYVLQDSIGRYVSYYNRQHVMDVNNPILYKSAACAAKARAKLIKYDNLEIKQVKLEVNNDYVYRASTGSIEDIRRYAKGEYKPKRQGRVEKLSEGLPHGAV